MGASVSYPSSNLIGEGLFGSVYHTPGSDRVIKRGKLKTMYPVLDDQKTDLWRELRAYDWVDSIETTSFQRFFARRFSCLITKDSTFRPLEAFMREHSQPTDLTSRERTTYEKITERTSWPYTYDLTVEYKGRPFVASDLASGREKMTYLIELLEVMQFMNIQGVIHTDMHKGNLLRQPDGHLALIDYGEMHFSGSVEYYKAFREHMMELQLTGLMSDSENFYKLEDAQPELEATTQDERISYFFANQPRLVDKLRKMCARIGYGDPESEYWSAVEAGEEPFLVVSFVYDSMKLTSAPGFAQMMNLPIDCERHSWFSYDKLEVVYNNLGDIPEMIRIFKEINQ